MDYDELQHHGIKGMRWGVIRTPAQLGHTVASKLKKGKYTTADGKIKGTGQKAKAEDVKAKKQDILKSRSAKKLYDNADLFTTKELQDAYNRLSLERNIKNLTPAEVSRGKQALNDVIEWGNKASDAVTAGTKLYNSTAKVVNAFNKGSKLPIIGEKNEKSETKIYDYASLRKKSLSDLADDELSALNKRNNAEKKYNEYVKSTTSSSSNTSVVPATKTETKDQSSSSSSETKKKKSKDKDSKNKTSNQKTPRRGIFGNKRKVSSRAISFKYQKKYDD